MEEKKRKGYKTQEQQNEANKRYRATEEGKKNTKHSTYKSRARVFINEMATLEELEELENLIKNKKMEVLKMKRIFKEIKGQVNFEKDLYVDKDNLDKVTGLCTVDFIDGKFKGMSVAGKVVNNGEYEEITIDDEAIVYNPAE
ncbi:hypothetical protein [Fusobacterium polymorphum]|uniref:hypothetical protein n=1 Tax=Fusobacterium nucleatum subsp. polymorphum TaxID=76857 RepID=UPI003008852E